VVYVSVLAMESKVAIQTIAEAGRVRLVGRAMKP
jgi:hypothetical protein